jgi:hypothetical protein
MIAREIIEGYRRYGLRLTVVDGRLQIDPKPLPPPETAPPELRHLARLFKQHRDEVIQLLQSERPEMSNAADMSNTADTSVTLPLNLVRIADAVAANPRSPVLTDMALAVFVRHAVEAQRTIERLPAAAKAEALAHCREAENRIVAAITGRDYQEAYALASALPGDLAVLTPQ